MHWLEEARHFGKGSVQRRIEKKNRIQGTLQRKFTVIFPGYIGISHAVQLIVINMNGRDCRSSLSSSVVLILGLKILDHLWISFKMDCKK